jgi:hypothetical protein
MVSMLASLGNLKGQILIFLVQRNLLVMEQKYANSFLLVHNFSCYSSSSDVSIKSMDPFHNLLVFDIERDSIGCPARSRVAI